MSGADGVSAEVMAVITTTDRFAACTAHLGNMLTALIPEGRTREGVRVSNKAGKDLNKHCSCGVRADWYIVVQRSAETPGAKQ